MHGPRLIDSIGRTLRRVANILEVPCQRGEPEQASSAHSFLQLGEIVCVYCPLQTFFRDVKRASRERRTADLLRDIRRKKPVVPSDGRIDS